MTSGSASRKAAQLLRWEARRPRSRMGGWFVMLGPVRDEAAPLLGRAEEQGLLASLLDGVGERGQALVLRGDPGIGKSRLLSVAAQTAGDRGMTVLTAT